MDNQFLVVSKVRLGQACKDKKIIKSHHECSCRIGKSHPRGWNFSQVQGFQVKVGENTT